MKKFIAIFTALCVALTLSAVASASGNNNNRNRTITDFVVAKGGDFDNHPGDYDILKTAVVTAGLADTLANAEADFTLFAPSDRAFMKLARDLGFQGNSEAAAWNFLVTQLTALGDGDPIPVLTNVLLYHVAPEAIYLDALFFDTDTVATALDGASLTSNRSRLVDADPDLVDAKVLYRRSNIPMRNGVVHGIDRVMIPLDL